MATDTGDWVVKGFIDVYRNIYTISVDTKVVSKIIELQLVVPLPGPRMVQLGGDQVTPGNQLVTLDGSVVMDRLPGTTREATAPR